MKRLFAFLLAAALLCGVCTSLCGCGETEKEKGGLSVVVTVFPAYDWVMNVLGGETDADVTMLLDSGVDLHSFQPSAADVVKIVGCDLFVYVGGESDAWVADTLREGGNENRVVLNLLEVLGDAVLEEETVEGMEPEHEHEHEDGEEPEYDEHVWLSLRNASVVVKAIRDALTKLDAPNAGTYAANADAYLGKLSALDKQYRDAVEAGKRKLLLFADRFPFRYLADDYGLDYYAAFSGCSAESEASFETVLFLAKKVDEAKLPVVLTLENSDGRIAQTVIAATEHKDARVLAMDSLQSTTGKDAAGGKTYLSAMEHNLEVLKEALA